ncbi:MAG: hypothetical protein QOE55_6055 [Acidobacteriaceae bacterium]|jgi:hypothetical protein|nr:hypothetical protein [Acidobacteriaceae bacterium]
MVLFCIVAGRGYISGACERNPNVQPGWSPEPILDKRRLSGHDGWSHT